MSASDRWCPQPLNCTETYGTLTVAGVPLQGPAWCAHDLSPLYDSPEFRGQNILVERLAGRVSQPVVVDETDYSLRVMFSGATDQDGNPWNDPAGGLLYNRLLFIETFIKPIQTGVTSSLTSELDFPLPSGSIATYQFESQPLKLSGFTLLPGAYARAVLEFRIPVPELVEVGP